MRNFVPKCLTALVMTTATAAAQVDDSLTRGYSAEECPSCDTWNEPHAPFRIFGNSYYVGTNGLGSVLITGPEGHVLIDGGLPNSAPRIMDNIRALGFRVEDVRLILNSHAHHDHAAGIAALQRASGARVAASAFSADELRKGGAIEGDPQYGALLPFPAVPNVETFVDGDTLRVGSLAVVAHLTPGHTPGGTTWSWRSCDGGECLDLVYADSQTPVSADDYRYSAHPEWVADFRRSHAKIESLACDILITPHPGASSLWQRLEKGPQGLIDRNACSQYAENARRSLERRLESER